MIPKVKNYQDTGVSGAKTRFEIEEMLEKHFKVIRTAWKREDPEETYLMFEYKGKDKSPQIYKVGVPFIEKKFGRYGEIKYDEPRAYRFFFHIFKSMMLNNEIGMGFEQIFSNFLVIDKTPDGTPINVQERILEAHASGKVPALPFDAQ